MFAAWQCVVFLLLATQCCFVTSDLSCFRMFNWVVKVVPQPPESLGEEQVNGPNLHNNMILYFLHVRHHAQQHSLCLFS